MTKKKSINVTVLVEESHKSKLSQISRELKGKGFVLKKTLGEIGVLTGSIPSAALADLSKVPGVSAVEKERTDYRPQD
jgi:hypothetical protein